MGLLLDFSYSMVWGLMIYSKVYMVCEREVDKLVSVTESDVKSTFLSELG